MPQSNVPDNKYTPIRFFYRIIQILVNTVSRLLFGLKVEGRENVPKTGAFILASNHQSWFDPPIVGCSCPREVYYAAKKELFTIPVLSFFVRKLNAIPVRRTGYDRAALFLLGKTLEAGHGITFFPEGTRYLDGKLHPPKPGVGMLAVKYKTPIVPVYVRGSARLPRQIVRRGLKVQFGQVFTLDPDLTNNPTDKEAYRASARIIMDHIALTGGVKAPEYNK